MPWRWLWKRHMISYCFVCPWSSCIGYTTCVWTSPWSEECRFYRPCHKRYTSCNPSSGETLRIPFLPMKYPESIYYHTRSSWRYTTVERQRLGPDPALARLRSSGQRTRFYATSWLACDAGTEFWPCCPLGNSMKKRGHIPFCEIIRISTACNKREIKITVLFPVKIK